MSKCFLVVHGQCADLPKDFSPKPSQYAVVSAWPEKEAAEKDCERKATAIQFYDKSVYEKSETGVWTHYSGTFYCVIEVPASAAYIAEKEIPFTRKKVELRGAFVWDCDECGRENFCTGPPVLQEEIDEIIEEQDLHDRVMGDWHTMPKEVTCKYCGSVFEADDGDPTKIELDNE